MALNVKENIRALRLSLGLTQAELGSKLHKGGSTVRMWELGRSLPDAETLVALSHILGVTVDFLLSNTVPVAPEAPEPSPKDRQISRLSKELNQLSPKQLKLINELVREIAHSDDEEKVSGTVIAD